ncbi:MAG: type II secretion system protein M [Lachnospiraceae bacterium]|nr:type II secretion system protein M [Lachnospiraceae bacterium]
MNMVITERDKKLLGILAAFLIALMFFLLVFKPLAAKNKQIKSELRVTTEQEADFDNKASSAQDMALKEEQTKEQLRNVLARYYPMQQSQGAERMVTTLMLNHNMSIQSLSVTMPETSTVVKWYQYSEAGREAEITPKGSDETEVLLPLYTARVTCVIEGSDQDLWQLVDDISEHYPAISISSAEWVTTEQPVAETPRPTPVPTPEPELDEEETDFDMDEDGEAGEEDLDLWEEEFTEPEPQVVMPVTQTVKSDRLTISFEIYMCNQ